MLSIYSIQRRQIWVNFVYLISVRYEPAIEQRTRMDEGLKTDGNENNDSNIHVLKPYCIPHSVVDIFLEMALEMNLSNLKRSRGYVPS